MNDLASYVGFAIIIIVILGSIILPSPFHYPYFTYYIDVTGKRNPSTDDLLDEFLNSGNFNIIELHQSKIQIWKNECLNRIQKSLFKHYRKQQFLSCLDDHTAFRFYFVRQKIKYTQQNYVKYPYKVSQLVGQFFCDYSYLEAREQKLRSIGHECTLNSYYSNSQRKLMTKSLRRKIMIRDKYTCQICGKYMPDEIGLQIDHIIPVSKGGKTVPSNLQVLCSRCNGHKSNNL